MDYKKGDIVYWGKHPDEDGEVIHANDQIVTITWNQSGGTQSYPNSFCSDIQVKESFEESKVTADFEILNYDGCTICFQGLKYKLTLIK